MMSVQHSLHMYSDPAIRFRDPFAVSKGLTPAKSTAYSHETSNTRQTSHSRYVDYARALTPPLEMTVVQQPVPHTGHYHSNQYHDGLPTQQAYRAPTAPHLPSDSSNAASYHGVVVKRPHSRSSPVRQQHIERTVDNQIQQSQSQSQSQTQPQPQQQPQQTAQSNAIASNFQIPRSVNESGGSLAELAGQITCLFWFESSDLLQQVEDAVAPLQPPRSLTPDAKPTTGFRKWVTTILSTTMVAQNVVVLALLFIYRLKKLNPTVRGKPGSEYRLLTVALMLGNKFLDDNTYTNKTWAEVSGINVGEVHIMEVEFLSNMKYCLFTSEQDWAHWQSLLGKFAAFFERASRPLPPAPILPPASSLHLPMALPSPPASNQASPPFAPEASQSSIYGASTAQYGPTPAPSPLGNQIESNNITNQLGSRKRSRDESTVEPPPKRIASGYQSYTSPQRYPTMPMQPAVGQPIPRLTLPSLSIPSSQGSSQSLNQAQQPPTLSVPARAMALVYPTPSSQAPVLQPQAAAGPLSQPASQSQAHYSQRIQSPYAGSAATSPSSTAPLSATALHPAQQISPTYFLQQRSSPYRPVHHVSTLLYPPPSAAMQNRPSAVELNQMQYQPLGRTVHHSGRLPYVSQNMWIDGNQPQEMTPIHQWPGMSTYTTLQHQHHQPPLAPQ